jgi:hypothetical protein
MGQVHDLGGARGASRWQRSVFSWPAPARAAAGAAVAAAGQFPEAVSMHRPSVGFLLRARAAGVGPSSDQNVRRKARSSPDILFGSARSAQGNRLHSQCALDCGHAPIVNLEFVRFEHHLPETKLRGAIGGAFIRCISCESFVIWYRTNPVFKRFRVTLVVLSARVFHLLLHESVTDPEPVLDSGRAHNKFRTSDAFGWITDCGAAEISHSRPLLDSYSVSRNSISYAYDEVLLIQS